MPSRAEMQARLDAQAEEILSLRRQLADVLPTPEAQEVLRTSIAEYRAGHRSDRAAAKDPAVVYTTEDRTAYQRALYEHYQAVRALLRTQAKEPDDVRP